MWSINEKTCITLIVLALMIIVISIPLYLGKVKRNAVYGFRIKKAFESDLSWYLINRYGARSLIIWAFFLVFIAIICLFISPENVLTTAKIGFISIIVPILLTLGFAKRI